MAQDPSDSPLNLSKPELQFNYHQDFQQSSFQSAFQGYAYSSSFQTSVPPQSGSFQTPGPLHSSFHNPALHSGGLYQRNQCSFSGESYIPYPPSSGSYTPRPASSGSLIPRPTSRGCQPRSQTPASPASSGRLSTAPSIFDNLPYPVPAIRSPISAITSVNLETRSKYLLDNPYFKPVQTSSHFKFVDLGEDSEKKPAPSHTIDQLLRPIKPSPSDPDDPLVIPARKTSCTTIDDLLSSSVSSSSIPTKYLKIQGLLPKLEVEADTVSVTSESNLVIDCGSSPESVSPGDQHIPGENGNLILPSSPPSNCDLGYPTISIPEFGDKPVLVIDLVETLSTPSESTSTPGPAFTQSKTSAFKRPSNLSSPLGAFPDTSSEHVPATVYCPGPSKSGKRSRGRPKKSRIPKLEALNKRSEGNKQWTPKSSSQVHYISECASLDCSEYHNKYLPDTNYPGNYQESVRAIPSPDPESSEQRLRKSTRPWDSKSFGVTLRCGAPSHLPFKSITRVHKQFMYFCESAHGPVVCNCPDAKMRILALIDLDLSATRTGKKCWGEMNIMERK